MTKKTNKISAKKTTAKKTTAKKDFNFVDYRLQKIESLHKIEKVYFDAVTMRMFLGLHETCNFKIWNSLSLRGLIPIKRNRRYHFVEIIKVLVPGLLAEIELLKKNKGVVSVDDEVDEIDLLDEADLVKEKLKREVNLLKIKEQKELNKLIDVNEASIIYGRGIESLKKGVQNAIATMRATHTNLEDNQINEIEKLFTEPFEKLNAIVFEEFEIEDD